MSEGFERIAWVRRNPDGTLTGEYLASDSIELGRVVSGAWLPMVLERDVDVRIRELDAELNGYKEAQASYDKLAREIDVLKEKLDTALNRERLISENLRFERQLHIEAIEQAIAEEREACAKTAWFHFIGESKAHGRNPTVLDTFCAASAIRARGAK